MNVFQYSAVAEANWKSNLSAMSDFTPKFTFYADFSIAEFCEVYMRDRNAVKSTYKNVIESWGGDIDAVIEIALVVNHKSWAFAEGVDSSYLGISAEQSQKFVELYSDLYYKTLDFVGKKFKDNKEALEKFYSAID